MVGLLSLAHTAHSDAPPQPPAAQTSLSSHSTAQGTPRLSLNELVRTVLEHNPGLSAAQQARVTASAAITSASALPNPRFELQEGHNMARVPSASSGQVRGLGVSQLIENPSLRQARREAALATQANVTQQIAVTRNTLVAQVHMRAYEYLLRQAEAAAAAEALGLLESVRERVRLRVESGEAARYEIIKADAEIISARQKQESAALQAEQALLWLNRLAAGRLPAVWVLDAKLNDSFDLPELHLLQAQALAQNPELLALQAELDVAQAQLQQARSSRWPGIELRYNHVQEPEVQHSNWGVSVQIPLLDQRQGPIAEAASVQTRIQTQLMGRQSELQQQVLLAWKSLDIARLKVQALSQGAIREAQSALRVAQAAYRFGERGILDVLDAQRVLRSVRADLLVASYELQLARIELEFLAGRFATPL